MSTRKKLPENRRVFHPVTESDSFAYVEAYKALRTNLNYVLSSDGTSAKVIMITSSMPGEGKSNVAINLAATMALEGKRVILLDCDLRKGTIARYLRISRLGGITDFLSGEMSLANAIQSVQKLGIDVMTSGRIPMNPSELLGSDRMGKMLSALSEEYDYVLCDTPPVNAVTDAAALGRYVDGAVLVVSHNLVSRESARAAKQQLEAGEVPVFGVVLSMYDVNRTGGEASKVYSYYNSGSYSEYGYGTSTGSRRTSSRTPKSR